MLQFLCAMGASGCFLVFFFLPETAQSLGHTKAKDRREQKTGKRPKFIWFLANPLRPLTLLLQPHIFLASIVSSLALLQVYALLVPLSVILGPRSVFRIFACACTEFYADTTLQTPLFLVVYIWRPELETSWELR